MSKRLHLTHERPESSLTVGCHLRLLLFIPSRDDIDVLKKTCIKVRLIGARSIHEATFKENHIRISIPVTRINFEERGDKLHSEFKIIINIYLDNKKIDSIEETKTLNKTEEELLETDEILFEIPYEPKLKGEYLFDIVVEDLTAVLSSKYRRSVRYKLKD